MRLATLSAQPNGQPQHRLLIRRWLTIASTLSALVTANSARADNFYYIQSNPLRTSVAQAHNQHTPNSLRTATTPTIAPPVVAARSASRSIIAVGPENQTHIAQLDPKLAPAFAQPAASGLAIGHLSRKPVATNTPVATNAPVATTTPVRDLAIDSIGIDAEVPRAIESNTPSGTPSGITSRQTPTASLVNSTTQMAPTCGHFTRCNSTWLFVPQQRIARTIADHPMPPKPKPENLFREVTAITELRRHTQPVVQLVPVNPYRSDSTDTTNTVRNESEQYFQAVANNQPSRVVQDIALDETPVHNDLILQRVVQTIGKLQLTREAFPYESSPSDVQHPPQQNASFIETLQWEVTGELDQANGQPRLSLHEVKLLRR